MKNKNAKWFFSLFAIFLFFFGWATTYWMFYRGVTHPIWLALAVFFLAMVSFSLYIFFSNNFRTVCLIATVVLFPAIILAGGHLFAMGVIWLAAFVFLMLAIKKIKTEQKDRVKLNVYMTLKRGVPIILTALSILIAGGFYFSLVEKQKRNAVPKIKIEIPESVTASMLKVARIVVPSEELGWIQQGITVDQYVKKTMETNEFAIKGDEQDLIGGILPRNKVGLPDSRQFETAAEGLLVENGRAVLSARLGIELEGSERMDFVINELVEKRTNELANGGTVGEAELLPVGAALALYVLLQTLAWLLGFAVLWTAAGLFIILVRLDSVSISKTTREVEEIM